MFKRWNQGYIVKLENSFISISFLKQQRKESPELTKSHVIELMEN